MHLAAVKNINIVACVSLAVNFVYRITLYNFGLTKKRALGISSTNECNEISNKYFSATLNITVYT